MDPADHRALARQLDGWIVQILAGEQRGMGLASLRKALWAALPPKIRESEHVLWVGHEIGRSLNRLKREGVVLHDGQKQLWRCASGEPGRAVLPAPPLRKVPLSPGRQTGLFGD